MSENQPAAGLNRAEVALCRAIHRESPDDADAILDAVQPMSRHKLCACDIGTVAERASGMAARANRASSKPLAVHHLRRRLAGRSTTLDDLAATGLFDPETSTFDQLCSALIADPFAVVTRLGGFQLGRLAASVSDARRRSIEASLGKTAEPLFDKGLQTGALDALRVRLAEIFVAACGGPDAEPAVGGEETSNIDADVVGALGWCTIAGAATGHWRERLTILEDQLDDRAASALNEHTQMAVLSSRRGLAVDFLSALEQYVETDDAWLIRQSSVGGESG